MTIYTELCPYCLDNDCKYEREYTVRYGMIGMFKFYGCGAVIWDGEQ